MARARQALGEVANVELCLMETDDSWARDIGPTFVTRDTRGRAVSCVA